jgi:ParB family transcriptional regulator, chromosome partitioning protein
MEQRNRPSSLAGKLGKDLFFGTSPDLPKIIELDLDQVVPNPDQPRKTFRQAALEELAASIEKHGLIQPVTVKPNEHGGYILVAGERRYRAHQMLGKTTIAAIVTNGNADEIALIENIQREDLNPLETAEALSQMMARYRYTQEELGKVIGKAQNTVSEFLKINSLSPRVKENYRTSDREFPRSVMLEIARLNDEDEQFRLWETVKGNKLSVRATRSTKSSGATAPAKSLTDQSLGAGRRFLKTLEAIDAAELAADPQGHALILEICNKVKAFAEALSSHAATNQTDIEG